MAIRERRKRIYCKRIPYGMQNFKDVILGDCYYVDKTPFIEDVEGSHRYFCVWFHFGDDQSEPILSSYLRTG